MSAKRGESLTPEHRRHDGSVSCLLLRLLSEAENWLLAGVVPIIVGPPSGESGTATLSALTGLGNLTEPEPDQQAAS